MRNNKKIYFYKTKRDLLQISFCLLIRVNLFNLHFFKVCDALSLTIPVPAFALFAYRLHVFPCYSLVVSPTNIHMHLLHIGSPQNIIFYYLGYNLYSQGAFIKYFHFIFALYSRLITLALTACYFTGIDIWYTSKAISYSYLYLFFKVQSYN